MRGNIATKIAAIIQEFISIRKKRSVFHLNMKTRESTLKVEIDGYMCIAIAKCEELSGLIAKAEKLTDKMMRNA